jgi:hypothetical protein
MKGSTTGQGARESERTRRGTMSDTKTKTKKDLLIDAIVDTRLRWYEEDGQVYNEMESALRYGRTGYNDYTEEELVLELAELIEGESDPLEKIEMAELAGVELTDEDLEEE